MTLRNGDSLPSNVSLLRVMRCPLAIESLVHKSDGLNWAPLRSRAFSAAVNRNHFAKRPPAWLRHLFRLRPPFFTPQAFPSIFNFHGLLF